MENITLIENSVDYYTGALFFSLGKGVILRNVVLKGNYAKLGYGGIYMERCDNSYI